MSKTALCNLALGGHFQSAAPELKRGMSGKPESFSRRQGFLKIGQIKENASTTCGFGKLNSKASLNFQHCFGMHSTFFNAWMCCTAGAAARASCHQHHHCQCSWALNKSKGWGGCFSFGGTVQYIEESNIYLCFVVCRLKRGLVT